MLRFLRKIDNFCFRKQRFFTETDDANCWYTIEDHKANYEKLYLMIRYASWNARKPSITLSSSPIDDSRLLPELKIYLDIFNKLTLFSQVWYCLTLFSYTACYMPKGRRIYQEMVELKEDIEHLLVLTKRYYARDYNSEVN